MPMYYPPPMSDELRAMYKRIEEMPLEKPASPYDLSPRTHALMDTIMMVAAANRQNDK
jgi:hypothetical protein